MSGSRLLLPPRWSAARLDADRNRAITLFIEERGAEGNEGYELAFVAAEAQVRRLLSASHDLASLTGSALLENPGLLAAARYACGPPLSSDDLATMARGPVTPLRTPAVAS